MPMPPRMNGHGAGSGGINSWRLNKKWAAPCSRRPLNQESEESIITDQLTFSQRFSARRWQDSDRLRAHLETQLGGKIFIAGDIHRRQLARRLGMSESRFDRAIDVLCGRGCILTGWKGDVEILRLTSRGGEE
jgi:hypothetical protein